MDVNFFFFLKTKHFIYMHGACLLLVKGHLISKTVVSVVGIFFPLFILLTVLETELRASSALTIVKCEPVF